MSGDISRPGSPAAPNSAFLGSVRLLAIRFLPRRTVASGIGSP